MYVIVYFCRCFVVFLEIFFGDIKVEFFKRNVLVCLRISFKVISLNDFVFIE